MSQPRAAVARGEVKALHLRQSLHSLVSMCGDQTSFSDPPAPGLRRAVLRCALAAAGRAAFPVLARALFVQLLPSSRLLLRRRQTLLVGARALSAAFAAVAVVAHGGACCLAF